MFFLILFQLAGALAYTIQLEQASDKIITREGENNSSLNYIGAEDLEVSENSLFLIKKINFKSNFNETEVVLILDEGYFVEEESTFPEGYTIEDGKNQILTWKRTNVSRSEPLAIFVQIEKRNYNLLYVIITLAILVTLTILSKKSKIFKNIPVLDKKNIDSSHLLDEERKILEELKNADRNELWQKNIQKNLGLSKAKTSRLIRNLEARNLIKKIPFGNTNKISLK